MSHRPSIFTLDRSWEASDGYNIQNIEIHLNKHEFLAKTFVDKFVQIVEELKTDKPIQYILGETEFAGIDFQLNSETLIPRPETEELVMWIVESGVQPGTSVLDIGTGSGCIIVSLGKLLKGVRLCGGYFPGGCGTSCQ